MAIRFLVAVGVVLLAAPAAQAQYPQQRDGLWVGFGLGYGSSNVVCDSCYRGPRTEGVTAFLKLGGTPSRHLLMGGALNGWSRSGGGAKERMANLTASLYYYPSVTRGLFMTGGLGVSTYHVDTRPVVSGRGWGLVGGLGYDIRVARNVSLTPVADLVFGGVGDLKLSGGSRRFVRGWKQNVIDFGLGLTFH